MDCLSFFSYYLQLEMRNLDKDYSLLLVIAECRSAGMQDGVRAEQQAAHAAVDAATQEIEEG